MLTALVVAMINRTAQTDQPTRPSSSPGLSKRVNDTVVWMDVYWVIAQAKPMPTASSPNTLVFLLRPRLRVATTFIQSSSSPTAPPPTMVRTTMMPVWV